MNDKDRYMVGMSWINMYNSLHQAILNAGGSGQSFSPHALPGKTVADMFNELATNDIRFYCSKTHKLIERPSLTVDPRRLDGV